MAMNMPRKPFLAYQHPLAQWAVVMVLLAVFFISASYFAYQREYAKAEVSAREAAQTYHLLTVGILEDLDRLVERAGKQYLHYPHEQNRWLTEQVLRERKFTNPHIMDLLVTDASGRIEVWTGNGVAPDVTQRSYIRHHLDNPGSGLFVSEPMLSLVHKGEWCVALSRAVRAGDGGLMGVGVAIIALAPLQETYARLLSNPALAVLVVHQSGKLVLRVPAIDIPSGENVAPYFGIALPVNAPQVVDVPASLDGIRRIVSIQPVAGTSLFVGGTSSLDEALSETRLRLLSILALWLMIGLTTFVLARKLAHSFDRERKSQVLYESLFTGVSDAIFVLGAENRGRRFRYLKVNPACEQRAGLSASQMIGKTPWDLLPATIAERLIRECVACANNGETITFEEQLDMPEGRRTWMTTLNPSANASGEISLIVGVARDITEQSRLVAHLQNINENLPGFVYQLQRDADGRYHYLYASDGVTKLLGITPEELLADANALMGAIHPDDAEQQIASSLEAAADNIVWQSRFRMVHRDGHLLWVEVQNTLHRLPDGSIVWTGYCFDISGQVRLEQALRESEASFRAFVENANDIIYTLSADGTLSYVSPNWVEALGHPVEEVVDHTLAEFVHPDDAHLCAGFLHRVMTTGTKQQGIEYRVRHRDGSWRWHISNASPLFDAEGRVIKCLGIARDITQRRAAEERIAYLAHYDQLTGLPNRVLFAELMEHALRKARREGIRLALMYIDLDKFKPVNDQYGHAIGDLLLQEVAKRMSDCLREADLLARIGGDEFVVLLQGIESNADALVPAGKILAELRRTFVIKGLALNISCCIGVAIYPDCGDDLIELTRHADEAMYASKNAGRDRVMMFEAWMAAEKPLPDAGQ